MTNLDKLLSDVSSWYWWLSVVVIGLGVNLLSSYLKPYLDSWYERRSSAKRQVRDAESKEAAVDASVIASDARLMLSAGFEEIRSRIVCVILFLFLFAFAAFGAFASNSLLYPENVARFVTLVMFSLALGFLVLANWSHRRAMMSAATLRRARLVVLGSFIKQEYVDEKSLIFAPSLEPKPTLNRC